MQGQILFLEICGCVSFMYSKVFGSMKIATNALVYGPKMRGRGGGGFPVLKVTVQ